MEGAALRRDVRTASALPLWREAISIVERGIADAETVDSAVKYSFGMRLPVLAPMENSDMVGADLTLSIHDYVLKHLESSPESSPLLRQKVAEGNLGFKTGQGFMKWSAEDIEKSRKSLIQHLLKIRSPFFVISCILEIIVKQIIS